jgi:hypothetical protein
MMPEDTFLNMATRAAAAQGILSASPAQHADNPPSSRMIHALRLV